MPQKAHKPSTQKTMQIPSTAKSPAQTTSQTPPHKSSTMPYTRLFYATLALFVFIALVRLASLALYPLMDPTEARYAEMARKMLELGDFVVLHFTYEQPFWGKPPLSFWGSAVGMSLFGVNEFGARIAPFLAGLLVCALFFAWEYSSGADSTRGSNSERKNNAILALASAIIMLSSALGLVSAGAVMTDEFLLLCVGLCMVGFWRCVASPAKSPSGQTPPLDSAMLTNAHDNASQNTKSTRCWGYAFFAGLGLGLLAKGPLIFVLAGVPIVGFIALVWLANRVCQNCKNCQSPQNLNQNPTNTPTQNLPQMHAQNTAPNPKTTLHYQNLPIVSGSILTLLIALPWYIVCEMRSEGFLEYFIAGEHFKRFLVSGWEGDLYGSAHSRRLGSIWIFFFVAFLPWSVVFVGFLCAKCVKCAKIFAHCKTSNTFLTPITQGLLASLLSNNAKNLYLALWLLTPLAFFTLSRNVLWTYVLPCAIPFSILLAQWIFFSTSNALKKFIWILPFALVGCFGAFIATQHAQNLLAPYHHKDIFTRFSGDSRLVYIGLSPSYSAQFYTHANNDALRAQNPAIAPLREEIYTLKDLQQCASVKAEGAKTTQEVRQETQGEEINATKEAGQEAKEDICSLEQILDSKERVSIAIKSSDFASFGEFFTRFAHPHFTPIVESKGITLLQNFSD